MTFTYRSVKGALLTAAEVDANFAEVETKYDATVVAKDAAEAAQTAAETAETNAETAETNAETAETNAVAARDKAKEWAENPEDTEVETGQYSALHHAAKAADSADAASTSETNAAASAVSAGSAQTAAEAARAGAETAEANAVAVVYSGGASLTPAAGKIPVADADGYIDMGWMQELLALHDDVYGLEWHKSTNTFTRLFSAKGLTGGADFDSLEPWASMQRCNVSDAGVMTAYHGDVGFDYAGTNGEVMVEVPKFYYSMSRTSDGAIILLSPNNRPGLKKYPAFIRNGLHLDYIYPSAFEGFYDSVTGMMRSIANVVPSTSDGVSDGALTPIAAYPATTVGVEGLDSNGGDIRNCRYWAQARGINWEQYDFLTHNALCMLAFVEYGTFDLQTAIGKGVVDKASGTNNNAELTGQTAGYAGGTDLGNASGQIATNGLKSMSYRGVENLYGNIWKWVDGLNIKADYDPYISDHGFESDKFTDPYYQLGVTLPSSNGYGGDFVLNDIIDFGFLTSALGGANNSGLFDYYYQSTGNRVAHVGGDWNNGLYAGPLYWVLYRSSANTDRHFGGRSLCLSNKYIRS